MLNRIFGVSVALSLAPALALANPPDAAEAAVKHSYFFGTWSCSGVVTNPHSGEQTPSVGEFKIDSKHGGAWIVEHFQNHTEDGHSYRSLGWVKYDSEQEQLVRYVLNNMGAWVHYTSKGWDGDTVVWHGETKSLLPRHRFSVTDTFTHQDDDTFGWTVHTDWRDGKGVDMYKGTCKRKPSPLASEDK